MSGNHPADDICDELEGDYPKDFMWRGWHPRCMCVCSSILMDRDSEEWKKLRSMSTEEYYAYKSPNNIKNVQQGFKTWCETHKKKLTEARKANKLPYFVRDNEKVVGKIVGWKEEEKAVTNTTNSINQKKGYKGRKSKNEAYEVYKSDKPTIITKEQEKNVLEIAKAMGIKMDKVRPMSFNEADKGNSNIYHRKGEEYKENCQSCVVVHEARLRGLDITANGYIGKKGSASFELGEHFELAWINPKTGKKTQLKDDNKIRYSDNWQKEVDKKTKSNGRYHIGINLSEKDGHVIVAERINGKLILYDPQMNIFPSLMDYDFEYLEILRVDKMLIDTKLLIEISNVI